MLISFLRCRPLATALIATVVATIGASQSALAQSILPRAFRVTVSQRWLDSGQQSRVVPFDSRTYWLFVHKSSPRIDEVTHHISLDVPVNATLRATIDASADGRRQRIDMTSRFSYPILDDSVLRLRDSLLAERPFSLPESRVWDLIPPFHPARLQPGERWIDTVEFKTEECGSSQRLYTIRVSTLVADTILGGRRLWVVSDSADVYYEEDIVMKEPKSDTLVFIHRRGSGVAKGRMLYDPELGLFRQREDTTALSGTVEVSHLDGPYHKVPARFEGRRRWEMVDRSTHSDVARRATR